MINCVQKLQKGDRSYSLCRVKLEDEASLRDVESRVGPVMLEDDIAVEPRATSEHHEPESVTVSGLSKLRRSVCLVRFQMRKQQYLKQAVTIKTEHHEEFWHLLSMFSRMLF